MKRSKLLKKIGIGTALAAILLTNLVTCRRIGAGVETKYIQTGNHDLYFFRDTAIFEYRRPLKFFRKDTLYLGNHKELFVKNKGETEIGDTFKLYHLYLPETVSYKFIKDPSQFVSEKEFQEGISNKVHPLYFFKRGEERGKINGILSFEERQIVKDKRNRFLPAYRYMTLEWREKELKNYKKFRKIIGE